MEYGKYIKNKIISWIILVNSDKIKINNSRWEMPINLTRYIESKILDGLIQT